MRHERILARQPGNFIARDHQGLAKLQRGDLEAGARALEQAVRLQPDHAQARYDLGRAYCLLGRHAQARSHFEHLVGLQPDHAEGRFYLGLTQARLRQPEAVLPHLERAAELRPDDAELYALLGQTLKELGESSQAMDLLYQALTLDPELAGAHSDLGGGLFLWGRYAEGREHFRRAMELETEVPGQVSGLLFSLHYRPDVSAQGVAELHRRFGASFETPLWSAWPPHSNEPDPERPLRVGLVSGDFRMHPVGHFVAGLLSALGPTSVRLHAYANQRQHDALTEHIRPYFAVWREVVRFTDDALAGCILADGVDILIDLSGHTADNRLLAFARKPAPVQVSSLGYPDSAGLTAIDHLLGDRWMLPESEPHLRTEQAWWLPETALCFTPPDLPVSVGPLPAQGNGYVTFGCLNKAEKINAAVLDCWARILRAVPYSRLLLQPGFSIRPVRACDQVTPSARDVGPLCGCMAYAGRARP